MLLASDSPSAKDAVALSVYRIGRELGSMAAALGDRRAYIHRAGSAQLRFGLASWEGASWEGSFWLGVDLDENANATNSPLITRAGSRASHWVVSTNEEQMIARHVWALLNLQAAGA